MKGLAVRRQSLAVATLVALACTACSGEPTDPYAADTEPFKALPKTIEFRKWLDEQGEPWKGITKVSSTAPDAATIRVNEPYDNEEGAERLIRLWGEYSGTNPSDLNVSIFDNDTGFIYANSVAD